MKKCNLLVIEGALGGVLGGQVHLEGDLMEPLATFNENPRRVYRSKRGPETKSRGARRHQGCTEDAPDRHQRGTNDAKRESRMGHGHVENYASH